MEILNNFSSIYCFVAFIIGAIFMLTMLSIAAMGKEKELRNKVHFYVARDKDILSKGMLNLWINKPSRGITMWDTEEGWVRRIAVEKDFELFALNPSDYDNLKWEDEPVEVFLNLED